MVTRETDHAPETLESPVTRTDRLVRTMTDRDSLVDSLTIIRDSLCQEIDKEADRETIHVLTPETEDLIRETVDKTLETVDQTPETVDETPETVDLILGAVERIGTTNPLIPETLVSLHREET